MDDEHLHLVALRRELVGELDAGERLAEGDVQAAVVQEPEVPDRPGAVRQRERVGDAAQEHHRVAHVDEAVQGEVIGLADARDDALELLLGRKLSLGGGAGQRPGGAGLQREGEGRGPERAT
ncbi:MAG: hypothetical protein K8I02_08725 [Candidatus Methylomirabilis sp.]|nr:hypothetical protein [Deltaproteobacteria bacterium]